MNCEQARALDLVGKYVTGQLPEQEMGAFEEHYFSCDDCLAKVQVAQAIRHGTQAADAPKVVQMMPRGQRKTNGRPSRWMYPVAAAAAILVITVIGWRAFSDQSSTPEVAHTQPNLQVPSNPGIAESPKAVPATTPETPQLMASNVDLGAVTPLAYRPSALRGATEDAGQRFQQVMTSYLSHDYRQVVAGLSSIPVAVPGSGRPEDHITDAGVQLYLGVSQLMLNQNGDAVRSLRRAAAYGDTPYLENAGFFLAKALIRQMQFAEASRELRRVADLGGDRQAEARQLIAKLNQSQSR